VRFYKDVAPDGAGGKSGGGPPQSRTLARISTGPRMARSVLEYASPLALTKSRLVKTGRGAMFPTE